MSSVSNIQSLSIDIPDIGGGESSIDRSPLLKPSEFWGVPQRRDCDACLAKDRPNPPQQKPIQAVWWEPECPAQDLFFTTKGEPFQYAFQIDKFFKGRINELEIQKIITPLNARKFLRELKIIEATKEKQRAKGSDLVRSTRFLREICAVRSRGAISSAEAFLKTAEPSHCEPRGEFSYRAAANPKNLIPERVAELARFTCTHAIKILAQSRQMDAMGLEQPTTVIIRGNYGAGKSRLSAQFVPNPKMIPSPDSFKADLRKGSQLTNQQVQKEGTKNFQKLMYELRLKGVFTHFIFDEALRKKDQVDEILETASTTGSRVVLREIDVPLLVSCLRVLSRNIETDPCIPFNQIADAFEGFRKDREKGLKEIRNDSTVVDYQLLATSDSDPKKTGVIVAEKTGSAPSSFAKVEDLESYLDGSSLYDQTVHFDPNEISRVRNTVITADLIDKYSHWGGINTSTLRFYLGSTIEGALQERAVETPVGSP